MEANLYIQRCLQLAQYGKGYTTPNPMVGAVLVHNGRIIGEGWHKVYGQAHAEVNCLESVAAADKHLVPESTMYVSLEPCAHTGKTPPCANRLVAEQVKKVVICNVDPFAQVSGRGIQILKDAGIAVETGVLEQEGLWVNRRFFCFHTQQRPYIILKWAQTTDGFIAPADRSRLAITNSHTQQLVHKWRTEEAAILVGSTTATNDNPQLTSRLWAGRQPLRVVLAGKHKLPADSNLLSNEAPTLIFNEEKDEVAGNVQYVRIPRGGNQLKDVLSILHQQKILSVIVEGGPATLNRFIAEGLWDEARILTGAKQLGQGIEAPRLPNSNPAFAANIDTDQLQLFVNRNSAYQYPAGMPL